jgi:hypothetical protein
MTTKLHINLSQGIIDIEGDPELVREIYSDFRERLLAAATKPLDTNSAATTSSDDADEPAGKAKRKRRAPAKRRANGEQDGPAISSDSPKLDKHLDTAKLPEFYALYTAKNHPEKILIFLKFLSDVAGVESPNSDQVFTCYKAVNEKLPVAFAQAFRDTSAKGYIDLKSSTEMPVTIAGDNHFNFKMKKASE